MSDDCGHGNSPVSVALRPAVLKRWIEPGHTGDTSFIGGDDKPRRLSVQIRAQVRLTAEYPLNR
jgi:hypothetical protein